MAWCNTFPRSSYKHLCIAATQFENAKCRSECPAASREPRSRGDAAAGASAGEHGAGGSTRSRCREAGQDPVGDQASGRHGKQAGSRRLTILQARPPALPEESMAGSVNG